jgi:hypothetical protein
MSKEKSDRQSNLNAEKAEQIQKEKSVQSGYRSGQQNLDPVKIAQVEAEKQRKG